MKRILTKCEGSRQPDLAPIVKLDGRKQRLNRAALALAGASQGFLRNLLSLFSNCPRGVFPAARNCVWGHFPACWGQVGTPGHRTNQVPLGRLPRRASTKSSIGAKSMTMCSYSASSG